MESKPYVGVPLVPDEVKLLALTAQAVLAGDGSIGRIEACAILDLQATLRAETAKIAERLQSSLEVPAIIQPAFFRAIIIDLQGWR